MSGWSRDIVGTDIDEQPCEAYKPLAAGGFGEVFLHEDVSPWIEVNGKRYSKVALKVPKEHAREELKSEVESLHHLSHENIVQILGMTEGQAPNTTDTAWQMALECVVCQSSNSEDGMHDSPVVVLTTSAWQVLCD